MAGWSAAACNAVELKLNGGVPLSWQAERSTCGAAGSHGTGRSGRDPTAHSTGTDGGNAIEAVDDAGPPDRRAAGVGGGGRPASAPVPSAFMAAIACAKAREPPRCLHCLTPPCALYCAPRPAALSSMQAAKQSGANGEGSGGGLVPAPSAQCAQCLGHITVDDARPYTLMFTKGMHQHSAAFRGLRPYDTFFLWSPADGQCCTTIACDLSRRYCAAVRVLHSCARAVVLTRYGRSAMCSWL